MNNYTDGAFRETTKPGAAPASASDEEVFRIGQEYLQRGQALLEGLTKRQEQKQELEALRLTLHRVEGDLGGIQAENAHLKQARDEWSEVANQKSVELARISERLEQITAQKRVLEEEARRRPGRRSAPPDRAPADPPPARASAGRC
ncbi:MAG: hypothetical protein JWN14_4159, partial [Chthonomonadales bacterium]|nr:hypothetical protein [Chthonomonadales bacterium]